MKNKSMISMAILILAVFSMVSVYSADNTTSSDNTTDLDLSTEGPINLSKIINEIKTSPYYEGYDNQTLAWMESLGDKKVFMGDGMIVVMNDTEAGKLNSEYLCDAYLTQFMNCHVLENHSLGSKHPKDVLYVENVKYMGEEIHYLQGS